MFIVGLAVGLLVGGISVLVVNAKWAAYARLQDHRWSEWCKQMNETWARLATGLAQNRAAGSVRQEQEQ